MKNYLGRQFEVGDWFLVLSLQRKGDKMWAIIFFYMEKQIYVKSVLRNLGQTDPAKYLVGHKFMADLDYPIVVRELPLVLDAHPRLLGIDCEMVMTAQGSELVRVVIINDSHKPVIDRWFLPRQPVTDYVTHITGLTSEDLRKNAHEIMSNSDVEEIEQICQGHILVGHDLANDLKVLPIRHSAFIDTLYLYPHPYGLPRKTKLKHLALEILNRPIQWGSHNPCQDAQAALDIVKKHTTQGKGVMVDIEAEIKENMSVEVFLAEAELDRSRVVGLFLRGSRALDLQLNQEEYISDWDYFCVYKSQSPINGRLIKLYNTDVTIYDEASFTRLIEGNDISLLQLFFLPQQFQFINEVALPRIDLNLLRESLGYHLGKCDRKIKRFNSELKGEKRAWKLLKTYHMKIRFLSYFIQFCQQGRIVDVVKTNPIWQELKLTYKLNRNYIEAEKWIIQKVDLLHAEVRRLHKSVRPLRHYGDIHSFPHRQIDRTFHSIQSSSPIHKDTNKQIVNPLKLKLVDQLLSNGLDRIDTFKITYRRHSRYPNLIQFHYLQSANFSLPICRESRGIVLDSDNSYEIVALPYFKFFDYNDKKFNQLQAFQFEDCKIYEKYDGSMATLYFYRGNWEVASSRIPDGENNYCFARPQTTTQFRLEFWKIFHHLGYKMPNIESENKTFVFELLSKDHIIVVRRSHSQLRLHGVVDRLTGKEEDHVEYAHRYGWRAAEPLPVKISCIEQAVEMAAKLNPVSQQGYVLCDRNYCRIKVKNSDYVRANWLAELNSAPGKDHRKYLLAEVVLSGEADTFCEYCPEWKQLISEWQTKIAYLNSTCLEIHAKVKHLTGAKLAAEVKKQDKLLHPFLFALSSDFDRWRTRLQELMPPKKLFSYLDPLKPKE